MKIFVKVKPGAKEEKIEKIGESDFEVWVKEPPIRGMANQAVIRVLADYFNTPVSGVKIISGHTSRHKTIQINE
ncbi:DUF167 domain-containing protein [Patescibacteria group bacterium]|nr:DUF167 domain-containing protein [Patescibacteria group bacterium]MBU4353592.1 DUF167 domain-containing protein [Patescibacteria group bacterium]MBU4476899.1 DUF167 domain-containing protein [Patescibacteria group bacterium]MCG2699080.1 DUF167 domain-containing protein [Candidatus Parcubacteria bacterium]